MGISIYTYIYIYACIYIYRDMVISRSVGSFWDIKLTFSLLGFTGMYRAIWACAFGLCPKIFTSSIPP